MLIVHRPRSQTAFSPRFAPALRLEFDKLRMTRAAGSPHARMKYDKKDDPAEKPSPVGEVCLAVTLRITGTDEVSFSVMLILAWYIFLSDYETGGASPSPTAQMIIITDPRKYVNSGEPPRAKSSKFYSY